MNANQWVAMVSLPLAVIVAPAFAADYLTAAEAQQLLFPEVTEFVSTPVTLSAEHKKIIKQRSGLRQRWDEQAVWRVERDGEFAGWFIVDNVIGKHEFITYGVGLSPDGEVVGIEIMSYRETHGDQVREAEWREHFVGKTLGDQFKLDKDVPNISGATLSSRNLLDGVKRLLVLQQVVLGDER